ncbi:MAG TPA: anthranilate synthase component I [Candidatus Atribacteria bacterium]|nr:anthranilate synthase component I [Candidatus Atribacteria bacterium]
MYYPGKEEFMQLDNRANMLTVYRKILIDTETAISIFQKMKSNKFSYLLENAEGDGKLARYSFIGIDPFLVFQNKGSKIEIIKEDKKMVLYENPLLYLRKLFDDFKTISIDGLPRFFGGGVGYFGYDMVRFIEKLPEKKISDLEIPDCILIFATTTLVIDHLTHQLWVIVNNPLSDLSKEVSYDKAVEQIERIIGKIKKPAVLQELEKKGVKNNIGDNNILKSNVTQKEFFEKVKRAKEYILAGDIFQVVLSQCLTKKIGLHPFEVYRSLRSLNPSPYMYYLNFGEIQVVGASPEPLVRLTDKLVESKPIAGTRPRGRTKLEDLDLEKEMVNDEKERAEHTMLVDLARNDLGRVCCPGTVKVINFMKVEKFSHVMHLVSEVEGRIQPDKDAFDVLEACFPAGTVSGAPKVRAMEIIDELEPNCRGPYAGAVGYIGFNGNMDTCITIRTIIFKKNQAYLQAGAGIVADSIPEMEYKETLNKSMALLKAIDLAVNS